ncbi:hypothetical protein Ahy_A07g035025 [Arachis hypogaea]|uniref:Uncharacterized protein n=1 Tax=Arachis hypogaea TaxID=3818 RepID=A0A445CD91_ARAHY|nr:hypothetical protein Ahy_A07g035025 [Arachis hypogaea]
MADAASSLTVTLEPKPSTLNHNPIQLHLPHPYLNLQLPKTLIPIRLCSPRYRPAAVAAAPSNLCLCAASGLCWASLRASLHPLLLATASLDPALLPTAKSIRRRHSAELCLPEPSIPPPGDSSAAAMTPGVASAAGGVGVPASVLYMQPMMSYQVPPSKHAILNGYAAIAGAPQTAVPPAGGFCCFHSSIVYYC